MSTPHIGVLESNLSGSGFDGLRAAKQLGCQVTFFTSGMERYLAMPGAHRFFDQYVDEIELCQTNALAPVMERVRAVDARRPLSAFMSMAEYEIVTAACVAVELGLPGPDPEAVAVARNKVHMRRRCAEHGVPMPAFRVVDRPELAAEAALAVGLPCVVKPADETSSADVRRCVTAVQAAEQAAIILAQRENIRGQRRHPEVLVEECVVGYEVSVEILAAGTHLHVLGVTDKTVGGNGRFVELGHLFPSLLPDDIRTACATVAARAVRAVGFDLGLAHVEVRHTAGGPRLIEVNPRPAGDRITELVDLSLDTSCLELVVRQYLGERLGRLPAAPRRGAAIRFLTATPGHVLSVAGLETARAVPGVCDAAVSARPGDVIRPLARNEDRVGHVLAVAGSAYVAARTAEAAANEIEIATVADPLPDPAASCPTALQTA